MVFYIQAIGEFIDSCCEVTFAAFEGCCGDASSKIVIAFELRCPPIQWRHQDYLIILVDCPHMKIHFFHCYSMSVW